MGELKQKYNRYYNYNRIINPEFPKVMLMETTNCCNHNCIFCSHSKMTRPKGFMREELAYRILKEAYQGGVEEVGFYMLGEPLLDQNLEKYIKYAKEQGFSYTFLTTNGFLLDEKRMISIIDSGLDSIKFSFNGGCRDHYHFAHGVDCFQQVRNNIIRLSDYRKDNKLNFKIYISSVLTRYTQEDEKDINEIFASYVDDIDIIYCHNQCGNMNDEVENALAIEGEYGVVPQNGFCFYPFNRLHITYEGYLTLCCADFQNFLVVEDLNNISLKDAWSSERFQQIRKRHMDRNLERTLCYNCINNTISNIEPLLESYAFPCCQEYDKRMEMIQSRIEKCINPRSSNL